MSSDDQSKAAARVLIAKDVLARLDAKTLIATEGTYCEAPVPDRALPCKVCALGAFFVAKADRDRLGVADGFKDIRTDPFWEEEDGDGVFIDDAFMRGQLAEVFGRRPFRSTLRRRSRRAPPRHHGEHHHVRRDVHAVIVHLTLPATRKRARVSTVLDAEDETDVWIRVSKCLLRSYRPGEKREPVSLFVSGTGGVVAGGQLVGHIAPLDEEARAIYRPLVAVRKTG